MVAGALVQVGVPGLTSRVSVSVSASRSCLSQAQRKFRVRSCPDLPVEGAAPARQAKRPAVGDLARQSMISASSRRRGRGRRAAGW